MTMLSSPAWDAFSASSRWSLSASGECRRVCLSIACVSLMFVAAVFYWSMCHLCYWSFSASRECKRIVCLFVWIIISVSIIMISLLLLLLLLSSSLVVVVVVVWLVLWLWVFVCVYGLLCCVLTWRLLFVSGNVEGVGVEGVLSCWARKTVANTHGGLEILTTL